MPVKSWIVQGTINQEIRKQVGTVAVSIERRHGAGGNGKRKRTAPIQATIDDSHNTPIWTAIVSGHPNKGGANTRPKLHALVVFYDRNGGELWRAETAALPLV